jgi:hypothetical protein
VTQAEGVVAKFLCRHPQTVAFGWMINGTALTLIEPRPPEIQDGSVLLSDGMGGLVSTEALNITAVPNYNATEIVCFAFLANGTKDLSSPALLSVQGEIVKHSQVHRMNLLIFQVQLTVSEYFLPIWKYQK